MTVVVHWKHTTYLQHLICLEHLRQPAVGHQNEWAKNTGRGFQLPPCLSASPWHKCRAGRWILSSSVTAIHATSTSPGPNQQMSLLQQKTSQAMSQQRHCWAPHSRRNSLAAQLVQRGTASSFSFLINLAPCLLAFPFNQNSSCRTSIVC